MGIKKPLDTAKKEAQAKEAYACLAEQRFILTRVLYPDESAPKEMDEDRRALMKTLRRAEKGLQELKKARKQLQQFRSDYLRGTTGADRKYAELEGNLVNAKDQVEATLDSAGDAYDSLEDSLKWQIASFRGKRQAGERTVSQLMFVDPDTDALDGLFNLADDMLIKKPNGKPFIEHFKNLSGKDCWLVYPTTQMLDKLKAAVETNAQKSADEEIKKLSGDTKQVALENRQQRVDGIVQRKFERIVIDDRLASELGVPLAIDPAIAKGDIARTFRAILGFEGKRTASKPAAKTRNKAEVIPPLSKAMVERVMLNGEGRLACIRFEPRVNGSTPSEKIGPQYAVVIKLSDEEPARGKQINAIEALNKSALHAGCASSPKMFGGLTTSTEERDYLTSQSAELWKSARHLRECGRCISLLNQEMLSGLSTEQTRTTLAQAVRALANDADIKPFMTGTCKFGKREFPTVTYLDMMSYMIADMPRESEIELARRKSDMETIDGVLKMVEEKLRKQCSALKAKQQESLPKIADEVTRKRVENLLKALDNPECELPEMVNVRYTSTPLHYFSYSKGKEVKPLDEPEAVPEAVDTGSTQKPSDKEAGGFAQMVTPKNGQYAAIFLNEKGFDAVHKLMPQQAKAEPLTKLKLPKKLSDVLVDFDRKLTRGRGAAA